MLKAQKLTLAVLISAAIISSAQASEQSEAKDLLKMRTVLFSSVQVTSAVTKTGRERYQLSCSISNCKYRIWLYPWYRWFRCRRCW